MVVPAWQQELFRVAAEAEADGVPPGDIDAALRFERQLMSVARTGSGWDALAKAMRADSAASWMSLVYQPASLTDLMRVWQNDFSFDPRPYAKQVRQPVLALFGGLDKSTPIESSANLANAIKPRTNLTIAFFPTANHAFLDAITGGNAEVPALSRFAPGMFDAMRVWLRAR
jgi:pimeloyl-ACP methyl ester carboxylesterase